MDGSNIREIHLTDEERNALEIIYLLPPQAEVRWITLKWLFSDLLGLVDAQSTNVLRELERKGLIVEDRGWVRSVK